MWDPQLPTFAERYRVIRYDTRGWGRTETEHVEFSNRGDVGAVLDHLGVASAYVLGLSRGGGIALDFALEQPERVDALVVAAGGVGGYQPELPGVEQAALSVFEKGSEEAWEAKQWERLADLETALWVDGPGQPATRVDPALRALVHDWILTTYRAEKEEGLPQRLEPPAEARLGELRVPCLVLAGSLDDPATTASCRYLAGAVAGARYVEFEGVAHLLNLERPEAFSRAVLEFLGEVESSRA